jgi:hypothetical protein
MAKPVEKEIVDFAEFTGNTAAVHSQSVLLVSPRAEPASLVEMEGPQATILTDSLSPTADLALYANPFTMECRWFFSRAGLIHHPTVLPAKMNAFDFSLAYSAGELL